MNPILSYWLLQSVFGFSLLALGFSLLALGFSLLALGFSLLAFSQHCLTPSDKAKS